MDENTTDKKEETITEESKELDQELTEDLIEEYDGVSHYVDLSKRVPSDYSQILISMAREERGHADMIEMILKDMCKYNFSNDVLAKKKKADEDLETV